VRKPRRPLPEYDPNEVRTTETAPAFEAPGWEPPEPAPSTDIKGR
jgi:hypothetical protein